MKRTLLALLTAGILLSPVAWTQDDSDQGGDESGRGVARVSLMNGDVSVRRGDNGDWVAAAINAPLIVYDHVLTGPTARAEIQFDSAHFLRLSSDTEVRLAEVDSNHFQVELSRGTVTLSVIRDPQAQIEVNTPNVSVSPSGRGMYRISVTDEGESQVTVRSGEAEAATPGGSERVSEGDTMLVRGTAEDAEFQMVAALGYDNWDRWNDDRDRRLESTQSYRYVNPDVQGADDLDSYGRWVNVPPYGWVWSPNGVDADWAPYRDGRWSWLDWYGWTWVGYEPWGWAPYHYGRWFNRPGFGWCWFPGGFHERHFWCPGLVAFFGFGAGFGSVGWVPLAPFEAYHPWYGRGYSNRTVINTSITNMYRNARVANGVTALDANAFTRGGRGVMVNATDTSLQRASLVRGPVPLAPSAESLRLTNRTAAVTSQRSMRTSQFYSSRRAPAVQRVPFSTQRQGGAAPATTGSGWRRVGSTPSSGSWRSGGQPASAVRTSDNPSWRRFSGSSPAPARVQQTQRPQYSAPRYTAPRSNSVRINPPIVRERAATQASGSRSSSGGGGGARPSSSGGGHSSGGGGHSSRGGGRSSGGDHNK
jgi:hypothetical protein